LTGTGDGGGIDVMRHIVFERNHVIGGSVFIHNADQVDIVDNVIIGGNVPPHRALELGNVTNARVCGGYIEGRQPGSAESNDVVLCSPTGAGECSNISFTGVTVKQSATTLSGSGVICFSECKSGMTINGCQIIGNGSTKCWGIFIKTTSATQSTRYGYLIRGNTIKNNERAIEISIAGGQLSGVNIVGNTLFDDQATPTQTFGIYIENLNPVPDGSLLISNNVFGRGTTTMIKNSGNVVDRFAVDGPGTCAANNSADARGGTTWWVRSGMPQFAAMNGDLAVRADGPSGQVLYVRAAGAWVPK